MSTDVIINPGNGLRYLPQPNTADMAYRFVRGSEIWACLFQYPNDISLDETPAVFLSTDSGATWALQDSAGAPISNKHGPTTVTYDNRVNNLNPSSLTGIQFVYSEEPVAPAVNYHNCGFNFVTKTYGAPAGTFVVDRPEGGLCFSSRPDNSLVVFYDRQTSLGAILGIFYRIYSSGSWSSEATLVSSKRMGNLAVDASGNTHVIANDGTYYRMDASNAIVAGPISACIPDRRGNLTIVNGKLYLGYKSGSDIRLATGSPVGAPSWSDELVAAGAGASSEVNSIWTQQIGGSYAIDLELQVGSSSDYTVDSQSYTANGLTVSWFTSDQQHIKQSVRTGATWSAPATIWTASPTAASLFSLAIRGGLVPGNRSFPR